MIVQLAAYMLVVYDYDLKINKKYGHRPIVLLGGGTTLIGDPSGKDTTRKILNQATIKRISKVLKKF